jgi:glycerophosphoryl diester phosphodiesterase
MQVIEQSIIAKTGNPPDSEDVLFLNTDFAAVIDGVTSKKGSLAGNVSVGRKAAELIRDELSVFPRETPAAAMMKRLNDVIRGYYLEKGILEEARRNYDVRCGAAIIIYSDFYREVWRVGDCEALIGSREITTRKPLDSLMAEIRSCFLETEIRRGKTVADLLEKDTGRMYIEEMLSRQIEFQNADIPSAYNYHVLDGFFTDLEEIEIFSVPTDVRTLVLASDGYPFLKPSLSESEAELAEVIREDPLCFRKFKSTKGVYRGNHSFDDRSYLKLDVVRDSVPLSPGKGN